MSWTVTKLADGADGAISEDAASFTVVYLLQGTPGSDTAIDAAQAAIASGIPARGAAYGSTYPTAYCTGKQAACLGNGWEYYVTCNYSTRADEKRAITSTPASASTDPASDDFVGLGFPDGYNPASPDGFATIVTADGTTQQIAVTGTDAVVTIDAQGNAKTIVAPDADPRKLPWNVEVSAAPILIERYTMKEISDNKLVDANPNLNTAGDPFDEAFKEEIYSPVITLSKNVPATYINPAQVALLAGSVNSDACRVAGVSIGDRQAIISNCLIRRAWFGAKATPYWELSITISTFLTDEGADIWILQKGFREKAIAPATENTMIMSGYGPITKPALLTAEGAKTQTPYYRRFARTNRRDWRPLGLPNMRT